MQATEFDEFSYQEMMTFLPLNSHPNPEKVPIIGGGDGGVGRECDKHPLVKEIIQCEIDEVNPVKLIYLVGQNSDRIFEEIFGLVRILWNSII